MTSIIRTIVRQRAAVILVALIVIAAGGFTATRMQLESFPKVSFDTVSIVTAYPGAAPDTVLKDVTKPVEAAVAGVPGINTLSSDSAESASIVTVQFNYGTDINQAESKISTAVSALPLPQGAQSPKVSTIDFSAFPIVYYAITNANPKATLQQTYTLVNQQIKPQLDQISGVAAADVSGGASPQVTIELHPSLMAKYGVTAAQVAGVLQANNVRIPAGSVTSGGVTQPVVTNGTLTTLAAIRNLPIGVQAPAAAGGQNSGAPSAGQNSGGQRGAATPGAAAQGAAFAPRVVYLRDVATVSQAQSDVNVLGTTPGEIAGIVRYNGQPAIGLTIRKNSDANIVQVADAVDAKLKDLQKQYPQLHVGKLFDSSTSIKDSVSSLVGDGVFGAIFAILVIFLFLRTVRTTLVTAVSIPLSIFTAIIILGAQGITLNVMTISAIAVAVGRVVDDAIVVLENIYRHVQEGEARFDAVVNGTREVGRAIIGSTITTVAVFLPIGFIGGILGQFFQPFALTVTFALVASLLVALTVVPSLGSLLIRKKNEPRRDTLVQRVYTPILTWSLGHRAVTVLVALVLFVGSLGLTAVIPKGFFPSSNETLATLDLNLRAGASLGSTTAVVSRVENNVIARQPGIDKWETIIGYDNAGAQRFGNASSSSAATLLLVYKPNTAMTTAVDRLRSALKPYETHGVVATASTVSNGPPNNVDVLVTGANQGDVTAATTQVLHKLRGVPGLVNLQSNLEARKPQLEITVDPRAAFLHGLTPATAALDIRQMLTGQTVTTVRLAGQSQDADVFVQVDPGASNTAARIKALKIGTPPVALGGIASVTPSLGPVEIARQSQQNVGEVTAAVSDSTDAGTVTTKVQQALAPLTKTWANKNITIGQAGIGQQLTEGFINLAIAMLVAIATVYLLMVILFRSLLVPFVILFALPLAVIGALVGLAITGRELDMSAGIGLLMLIGIVVTNAIVLLDLVQHKIEAGEELRQALIEGGRTRVRPILMTAVATVLALIPLAIGGNNGGIIAANLATVVIGGLITSTLLTLVVMPVIYSLFSSLKGRLGGGGRLGATTLTPERAARGPLTSERVALTTES